jgi:hypothetical protein
MLSKLDELGLIKLFPLKRAMLFRVFDHEVVIGEA